MDERNTKLNAIPDANNLFSGIGGNYNSINQVISELLDNGISSINSFENENRTLILSMERVYDKLDKDVIISIEDNGTGIKDLCSALCIGDKSNQQTLLNEHGFGMVQALSAGNPKNDNWTICTRTNDEFKKGIFRKITAPYQYNIEENTIECNNKDWNGEYKGSGTIISFKCSYEFFLTVSEINFDKKKGTNSLSYRDCLDYLVEELGHIYSGMIETGNIKILVKSKNTDELLPYLQEVKPVKPKWEDRISGKLIVNLDGKDVLIEYVFGLIDKNNDLKCHYKGNMATNGVEIRINGRLFKRNVFTEIWGVANHPDYNYFYGMINIISDDADSLPRTKTDKSDIRSGDKKLLDLYKWVARIPGLPMKSKSQKTEKELVDKLINRLREENKGKFCCIEQEFYVFKSIGIPAKVDVYLLSEQKSHLFEAKKSTANSNHLYQLEKYWDGAVVDNIIPSTATLIVSSYDEKIIQALKVINSKKDTMGNNYNLIVKTWSDYGINIKKIK